MQDTEVERELLKSTFATVVVYRTTLLESVGAQNLALKETLALTSMQSIIPIFHLQLTIQSTLSLIVITILNAILTVTENLFSLIVI